MLVQGKTYRTIRFKDHQKNSIEIIDQRHLPHRFALETLSSSAEVIRAISEMQVRGAVLIGAAAAYGMVLATREAAREKNPNRYIHETAKQFKAARPTAVNLAWAVDRLEQAILVGNTPEERLTLAHTAANALVEAELVACRKIGENGLPILRALFEKRPRQPVNVLTHCNAGWLACVDYGTATAPIYAAHAAGIRVHVWVDETRPWNQGAKLTAWELAQQGIPHTLIADNTGGHLMQHGMVDLCIVGCDRATARGDVANKIGTYLKALAAKDNHVPFYVALPLSTFDLTLQDGIKEIPIEERGAEEVTKITGWTEKGFQTVHLAGPDTPAANYGFDVTPARLVTGLITEKGICAADSTTIQKLFA
jgi:methylthioribose-1-phosphate isomerase